MSNLKSVPSCWCLSLVSVVTSYNTSAIPPQSVQCNSTTRNPKINSRCNFFIQIEKCLNFLVIERLKLAY